MLLYRDAVTASAPPDKSQWSSAFSGRVDDAIRRLRRGESLAEIRELHGGVVVNAAKQEILRRG